MDFPVVVSNTAVGCDGVAYLSPVNELAGSCYECSFVGRYLMPSFADFCLAVLIQAQRLDAFGDWLEEQELPEELRPRTEG